ncbi:hypothetical protein Mame01_44230 [Microbispora amethystogenes]|nr:hypothetical protein Mame01_44230 [Microbispora amethystogenes]
MGTCDQSSPRPERTAAGTEHIGVGTCLPLLSDGSHAAASPLTAAPGDAPAARALPLTGPGPALRPSPATARRTRPAPEAPPVAGPVHLDSLTPEPGTRHCRSWRNPQ